MLARKLTLNVGISLGIVLQALRKEPMTVYGDGKQTRSFQYVSDLVQPISSDFGYVGEFLFLLCRENHVMGSEQSM
jgi:dTDP-D-glucose 4,6-dehydratase